MWERAIRSPAVSWIVAHPDVVELGRPYERNDTLNDLIASAKAAGKKVAVYNSARYDKEDWEPTADREFQVGQGLRFVGACRP